MSHVFSGLTVAGQISTNQFLFFCPTVPPVRSSSLLLAKTSEKAFIKFDSPNLSKKQSKFCDMHSGSKIHN